MFSIFGVSDFICDMTEINYQNNEPLLVKPIDDIFMKNLSTHNIFESWILKSFVDSTTGNLSKLLNASKRNANIIRELLNNQIIISTDSLEDHALIVGRQHRLHLMNFERLDMDLPIYLKTIHFQTNSPFLSKYALVHNRISEFGL